MHFLSKYWWVGHMPSQRTGVPNEFAGVCVFAFSLLTQWWQMLAAPADQKGNPYESLSWTEPWWLLEEKEKVPKFIPSAFISIHLNNELELVVILVLRLIADNTFTVTYKHKANMWCTAKSQECVFTAKWLVKHPRRRERGTETLCCYVKEEIAI